VMMMMIMMKMMKMMMDCMTVDVAICLPREYLATFKKTVAMHEVFLQRIAAHPSLRGDVNFEVFLSYDQDVSIIRISFIIHMLLSF